MEIFCHRGKQIKDHCCLIISKKAQLPNNAHKLTHEFKLSEDDLELVYTLPHIVALEPYAKAFDPVQGLKFDTYKNPNYIKLAILSRINARFATQNLKH